MDTVPRKNRVFYENFFIFFNSKMHVIIFYPEAERLKLIVNR